MNIKKRLLVLLLLLSTTHFAHADFFHIGPRLGGSKGRNSLHKISYDTSNLGVQLGAVMRFQLPLMYIQPEVLAVFDFHEIKKKNKELFKSNIKRLLIPITLGISFFEIFRIQAGIMGSIPYGKKVGDIPATISIKKYYEKLRWSYQGGIGLDVGNIIIDLNFEGEFTKLETSAGGMNTGYRPKQVILKVGYWLL